MEYLRKWMLHFHVIRDEKVYVQHRMLEHSKELYQWLQEGAYFYVCGDKDKMAKDVQNTLIEIIEKEGNLNREQAEEYLAELKTTKTLFTGCILIVKDK